MPPRRGAGRRRRRAEHEGRALSPPLRARFSRLIGSASAGSEVIRCYEQPHRRYHTVEHLREALAAFDTLADLARDPVAAELAVWFHDLVYDPTAAHGANEAASAERAVEVLGSLGVPQARVDEVRRLVLLTVDHQAPPGDANAAVVVDADLSILGATPERYARYVADVRAEHAHVDDAAWSAGRMLVLDRFLGRRRLFTTERAHQASDAAARRNLAEELVTLRRMRPATAAQGARPVGRAGSG